MGSTDRELSGTWWCGLEMAGSRYGNEQGAFWGDQVGPNPKDRAKNGVKRSLLVEADGGPLRNTSTVTVIREESQRQRSGQK